VYHALPDLFVSIAKGIAEEKPQIDWAEYWNRIAHFTKVLGELKSSGVYEPDIIMGISNGGLLLADTLLRIVYSNATPLISLWAARNQNKYFENFVNDSLITSQVFQNIKCKDSSRIRILLVDDMVGSRRTFLQLIEYLKERLGDLYSKIEIRFAFIYTTRQETVDSLSAYLLSNDIEVRKHIRSELETVTKRTELPYRKSIHYGDVT